MIEPLGQVEEALAGGAGADALTLLAWLAGQEVQLDADTVHAAVRRAMLLLAAGGDPQRALDLQGRAVTALAADLDAPAPRAALAVGIAQLRDCARGFPLVLDALGVLRRDPELAWRAFACSLLAEELGEED